MIDGFYIEWHDRIWYGRDCVPRHNVTAASTRFYAYPTQLDHHRKYSRAQLLNAYLFRFARYNIDESISEDVSLARYFRETCRMLVGIYVERGSIAADDDHRVAAGIDQATSVMTFDYPDRNSHVVWPVRIISLNNIVWNCYAVLRRAAPLLSQNIADNTLADTLALYSQLSSSLLSRGR